MRVEPSSIRFRLLYKSGSRELPTTLHHVRTQQEGTGYEPEKKAFKSI